MMTISDDDMAVNKSVQSRYILFHAGVLQDLCFKGPLCRISVCPSFATIPFQACIGMYGGQQVPIVYVQVLAFTLLCFLCAKVQV